MFTLLAQRRLLWLGHVSRIEDGRILKDMLYGELATGSRPAGWPVLLYTDVCKQDLKAGDINPAGWEAAAALRPRQLEDCRQNRNPDKREEERRPVGRLERAHTTELDNSTYRAKHGSRIQLYSHRRRCNSIKN